MEHDSEFSQGVRLLREEMGRGERQVMADKLGISLSFLHRVLIGAEKPGAELCARIERETQGRVTRADLRPDIFGDLNMRNTA